MMQPRLHHLCLPFLLVAAATTVFAVGTAVPVRTADAGGTGLLLFHDVPDDGGSSQLPHAKAQGDHEDGEGSGSNWWHPQC